MSREPTSLDYRSLTQEVRDELSDMRSFVAGLVQRFLPTRSLTQEYFDFETLQLLVDLKEMRNANFGAWAAVGVAFGDAVIPYIPGMAWCLATADDDTYAALRYKETGLSVAAITMLWKRVERGEPVDVQDLAGGLKAIVEANAPQLESDA